LYLCTFSYLGLGLNSGRFQTLGGKETANGKNLMIIDDYYINIIYLKCHIIETTYILLHLQQIAWSYTVDTP